MSRAPVDSGRPVGRWEWERALRDPDAGPRLKTTDVLVGLALATYVEADGTNAWPAQATLARGVRRDRQTVGRALRRLVDAGWLEVTGSGPKGTKVYRLTVPTSAPMARPGPAEDDPVVRAFALAALEGAGTASAVVEAPDQDAECYDTREPEPDERPAEDDGEALASRFRSHRRGSTSEKYVPGWRRGG